MPSCAATRRASSTSLTLQQPESDSPPQSLSVTPVTSWPCSSSNAAATDESTPPLIATSTRSAVPCPFTLSPWGVRYSPDCPSEGRPARSRSRRRAGAAQLLDRARDDVERDVDVVVGAGESEAQTDRRERAVARQPHR